MADGAGAGAGGDRSPVDEDLDGIELFLSWEDVVDELLRVYDIADEEGKYNRHNCHQGTVPDTASRLFPHVLPDRRDSGCGG